MPTWTRRLLWFLAAVAIVFAAGFYREGMQTAEAVHFALNYPATGNDVGGLGARGTEGKIKVDIEKQGLVKKLIQPNVVNLSTHWLHNASDKPMRVKLAVEGFKSPVRWESIEKTWNEEDHSIGRELPPGSNATVDWFITLPRPLPPGGVLDEGNIVVYNADSGEKLSVMPVKIVRITPESEGGD